MFKMGFSISRPRFRAVFVPFYLLCGILLWETWNVLPDYRYRAYVHQLMAVCAEEEQYYSYKDISNLCPCIPPDLKGRLIPDLKSLISSTWASTDMMLADTTLEDGGHWRPAHCQPRRRVAVIIPYRDRERHLRAFLAHTHPILQRQVLQYRIFVVEQDHPYVFNKGSMMNIGFLESQKAFDHDCVLFHDVDLLMENDRHIVACTDDVQHMGVYIDHLKYTLQYESLIGGALLMSRDTFSQLNGYSNSYFGWGGEDDDLEMRMRWQNKTTRRAPSHIASYSSLRHERDHGNPIADDRRKAHNYTPEAYSNDGVNNVKYSVVQQESYALYTWILVQLNETASNSMHFNSTVRYNVSNVACSPVPRGRRYLFSRATCKYTCAERASCRGFYYIGDSSTDSFCIMLKYPCAHVVPSDSAELYTKIRRGTS